MTNCINLGRHLTSLAPGFPFCRAEIRLPPYPKGAVKEDDASGAMRPPCPPEVPRSPEEKAQGCIPDAPVTTTYTGRAGLSQGTRDY